MKREATISPDGLHRYDLTRSVQLGCTCVRCFEHYTQWRTVSAAAGYVLWVLCNPSIADAEHDDATERRGWGFSNRWGYGKFVFVNTNPFRSTDAAKARGVCSDALLCNDEHLIRHARAASVVVCAWGLSSEPSLRARTEHILRNVAGVPLHHLGLSKAGVPKHPLYLKETVTPTLWV